MAQLNQLQLQCRQTQGSGGAGGDADHRRHRRQWAAEGEIMYMAGITRARGTKCVIQITGDMATAEGGQGSVLDWYQLGLESHRLQGGGVQNKRGSHVRKVHRGEKTHTNCWWIVGRFKKTQMAEF